MAGFELVIFEIRVFVDYIKQGYRVFYPSLQLLPAKSEQSGVGPSILRTRGAAAAWAVMSGHRRSGRAFPA